MSCRVCGTISLSLITWGDPLNVFVRSKNADKPTFKCCDVVISLKMHMLNWTNAVFTDLITGPLILSI